MVLLEQLGDIYWHASFYHDFFKLAASHSQGPTTNTNGNEQDPLVAFFNDHMPTNRPVGKAPEIYSQSASRRRTPPAHDDECDPTKPTAAPNRDNGIVDHSSMVITTTADTQAGFLAPTLQTISTAYELGPDGLELGDIAIPDTNLQLFEDWLDEFGYFHNIFPSA
jgi:hypothetical protein